MSTSEEKLFILKMLEQGKISSEEAARLIEALDGGQKQTQRPPESEYNQEREYTSRRQQRHQRPDNFHEELSRMRERVRDWSKDFKTNYNQTDFDRAVEEISVKAEKIAKNFATTTAGVVDKVVDFVNSFVDTNSFNIFGSYTAIDKSFEAPVTEGMDLYIEAINGHILVRKHAEDNIIIRSRVRSPYNSADNILMFSNSGTHIDMRINKVSNLSVLHEVLLPSVKFNNIKLETVNAKIYVEDAASINFEAVTKNSHIDLMGVNSEKIIATTKNARVQLSYVISKDIDTKTDNASVDIKHVKAEQLKVSTTNGRIALENVQNHENNPEMNIVLKTNNAGIKVNMDDMENRAYKVIARTSNGGINLLIPEMLYSNGNMQGMGRNFVDAESRGYADNPSKVNIAAETTNAYIELVK